MPDDVKRISAEDAKKIIDRGEGAVFIDVRNPTAWAQSSAKIRGAWRITLGHASEYANDIPRDRAIIAYCT